MNKVSVKDLIIGALMATLFFMLLGAGPNNNTVGRYTLSTAAAQDWGMVCISDSLTGDTRCTSGRKWGVSGGGRYTPDFSRK
jgi:hypothetical protein